MESLYMADAVHFMVLHLHNSLANEGLLVFFTEEETEAQRCWARI